MTARYAVGVNDGNVVAGNIDVDCSSAYFRADLKSIEGDCCNQAIAVHLLAQCAFSVPSFIFQRRFQPASDNSHLDVDWPHDFPN